ncbi:hypothetical protein HA402_011181 [Bradysia odoriphaga]|nr:hypothetical protein HA402_011181 [Bradysia odoriphaga]
MIVENIQYFYGCAECPFSEIEIRTVCGIINVNAFFAESNEDSPRWRAKCMFKKASLFAHSCSPNCYWNIELKQNESKSCKNQPDIQIEVATAIPIKKGEMLTIFYSTRYALYGTLKRIVLMEEIAHFQCKCYRCRDNTEMKTFMSAVKCFDCKRDYLLPEYPTEVQSDWKCLDCGSTQNVCKIVSRVCEIEDQAEQIQGLGLSFKDELALLSTIARKASGNILHKNHYVLQEIATRMIQLLIENGILNIEKSSENTIPDLELFVNQCTFLLNIAQTLLSAMNGYIGK